MLGRKDVERELIFAEAKIESLKDQLTIATATISELKGQIERLQDALISVRAPEAYRDQQIEKDDRARIPVSQEVVDRNKVYIDTTKEYLNSIEQPLIRHPDELDDLIAHALLQDHKGPTSLHGNNES